MVNANNEMDGTDFSTTDCPLESTINVPPMSHTPRKNGVRLFKYKSYYLKKKPTLVNVTHLQNESSMVQDSSKLVCKPMTVRLTRLPDSELRKLTPDVSSKAVPLRRTPIKRPLFKFYGYGKRRRKNTINTEECDKDCVPVLTEIQSNKINITVDNNKTVHKNVHEKVPETNAKYVHSRKRLQVKTASKVQTFCNHEQCKKDLLKTVKQPIIILNRIDEVINKLAQSFAKVATNKQNHTVEQLIVTQNIAVTQTEDIGLTSPSKSDCSWNHQVDDNNSVTDSEDLYQLRLISKRKRKLFYDSSDESDIDRLHNETSIQANMSKLSTLQKEIADTSKCNELRRDTPVQIKKLKLSSPQKVTAKTADKHTDEEDVENPLLRFSDEESMETGIVNSEPPVENEDVNIKNNKVGVQEPLVQQEEDPGIKNVEVDNREERMNVESIRAKDREERINVESTRAKDRKERITVESMQAVVARQHVDVIVEGLDADVENEDTDIYIANVENKEMHVKSDKVDVETANTKCSSDASENAVQVSTKNITGDSASSLLPTEINVVHNSREHTSFKPMDELVGEAGEIQQHKWRRSISESGFTQKYKLSKQAKILLVDLQHIKSSCGVAYSKNVAAGSKPDNNNTESNVCSTESESTDLNISLRSENITGRKGAVGKERLSNNVLKKDKLYKMMSDGAIGYSVSSHLPKRSTKELGSSSASESTIKTLLPSPRKSGHSSSTIKDQSKDITFRNQVTDGKKSVLICVPITSPTKYEKLTENKDSSKSKESSSNYKCIVCDLYFDNYSVLQQHLTKHAKQQLPSSKPKHTVSERCDNIEEILQPPPLTPERQTLPQSAMDKIICKDVAPSDNIADKNVSLHKRQQKKLPKHKGGSSKKKVSCKPCKLTNECSVCFQEFPTRADLAAHIFLHTESELQVAYEAAKQKRYHQTEVAEWETQITESTVANAANSVEKLSTNTNECKTSSKSQTAQKQSDQTSKPAAVKVPEEVKETDPKTSKPINNGESDSNNHVTSVINKMDKAKTTKKGGGSMKTLFTICQCHNKADVNFNYLQIEIVLLCHTCRVLFRTIECLETHYRLPAYSACNQNRPGSGRSPNLFCATCGMIFSSVQDVRQHLEMHIRFKKNCTIDFRCNICKVMFIGIGSLFHLHWSKHTKDSFWVASEQSFPKISLIDPKAKKQRPTFKPGEFVTNRYVDNYFYVAEYVCSNCKVAFVNDDYLKTHLLNCKAHSSEKSQTVQSDATEIRQLELHLICSLCQYASSSKLQLYAHMKDEHKFASEPQFVCVPLKTMTTTYICSICMDISENSDKFNEHWLSHYVKQPYFVCIYCNKDSDSVDAFKEHAKEHELATRQNISCKVNYRDAEHVCKICHVGVESEKLLNEHSVIHNLNDLVRRNGNEVTTQKSIPQTMLSTKEPDEENKATEKQATECSKSVADLDKEKLISILEGNEEEDSENELVIDLAEYPENQSAVKDRPEQKKLPSTLATLTLSAATLSVPMLPVPTLPLPTSPVSTLPVPTSPVPTLPAPRLPTTELNPAVDSGIQTILQNDVQSTDVIDITNDSDKDEDPIKEAEASEPTKRQHGFLRVKALTELLEDTSNLCMCHICNYSCETTECLRQHYLTHVTEKQPQPSQPGVPVFQQPASSAEQSRPVNKTLAGKTFIRTGRTVQVPLLSRLYPGTATNAKLVASKLNPAVSSAQASAKTAYHKNLPPCNIVRKIIVRRGAIQSDGSVPTTMEKGSSDAQTTQTASTVGTNNINHRGSVISATDSNKNPTGNSPLTANVATAGFNNYMYETCHSRAHDLPKYPLPQPHLKREVAEKNHNMGSGAAMRNDNVANGNQNYSQAQHNVQNQARMNTPASVYYQYPNSEHVYAGIDQGPMQSQRVMQQVQNHTVPRPPPPSYYYKNPSVGGMSIVINQAAPAASTVSTVDIRQQQGHQPRIYPVYTNPVVPVDSQPYGQQRSQNIIDYTGTGEVYQVSPNEYRGPISERVTTSGRTIEPSANLTCPYCPNSLTFATREMVEYHLNINHNYVCDLCGLLFYNIDDIRIHKIKHGLMDN
ncbi:uncharacterized protein LOC143207882 isoform X2 [Lasioglossum baleicum]|uniref:uncharacterized protein LOC143207882 isoform X2 n=1 Tax=Lasioglossum baleicum TaxID=434251 RepID=UPI003FCD68C1